MTSSATVGEDGDTDTGEVRLFALGDGGLNIAEIQENGEDIPLLEKQDVGVEQTDKAESGVEQVMDEEFPAEEKNGEDEADLGIPQVAVLLAVAMMFVFIGIFVSLGVQQRRKRRSVP